MSMTKNGTVAKAYAEFTREVIQCGEKQRNKHESSSVDDLFYYAGRKRPEKSGVYKRDFYL